MTDSPTLVEVVRSGFVECLHRGSVVALDADGSVAFAVGDPERPILPRSSNKPMQAVAMLRAGLDLDGKPLALACASHSGEPFHLDGVREILAGAGLDESALQTPAGLPGGRGREAGLRRARRPSRAAVTMNCSRQACGDARDLCPQRVADHVVPRAAHPLQVGPSRDAIEGSRGGKVSARPASTAAGAPFGLTLAGLARAFRAIALAPTGPPSSRVAASIRSHPEWLGGTRRDVTRLIEGVPGLIAKDGAEGVYAAALPDGRAVALKIEDGGQRARPPVMVAPWRTRRRRAGADGAGRRPTAGRGRAVGSVRVAFDA